MYENPAVFSVNELSQSEKIGQLLMPRIDFNDPDSLTQAEILVSSYGVCGFIIFNGNIKEVKNYISKLQNKSKIPLLFGCDAERGLGQIVSGATYFPFLMSQGAINDNDLLTKQAEIIAEELIYCGFNLVFAPVLDINSNPNNPIINIRSFGDDKDLVSKLGTKFIEVVQKEGILACGKHFPGHGSTSDDSHEELPVVYSNLEELKEFELESFKKAIEQRLSCIMPAHISYPNIDRKSKAVTVSEVFLKQILRNQLGFNGLVISDSFKMDALNEVGSSEEDNTLSAIKAGVDIVLDPKEPIELIKFLSSNKELTSEHINSKLNRISFYKKFINTGEIQEPNFKRNKLASEKICKESVCLVRGNKIKNTKALVFIYDLSSNNFHYLLHSLDIDTQIIDQESMVELGKSADDISIICIVSTKVAAWTNKSKVTTDTLKQLMQLKDLKNEKILLSFGSPYIIKELGFFDTVIASFDSNEDCQRSVADALLGKYKPTGILPVNLG